MLGKSIRIFLPEGNPTGMLIAPPRSRTGADPTFGTKGATLCPTSPMPPGFTLFAHE